MATFATLFKRLMWLKKHNSPEMYFILRLYHYGKIGQEEKDIEFAHICGIPNCCCDFFIYLRRYNLEPYEVMNNLYGEELQFDKFHYIRCPKCIINERR